MNALLLLGTAAIILPIALYEARRKWRDRRADLLFLHGNPMDDAASVQNDQPARALRVNPSVERDDAGKAGTGGTNFDGPMWLGYDHGADHYCAAPSQTSGESGSFSAWSGGGCSGGDA